MYNISKSILQQLEKIAYFEEKDLINEKFFDYWKIHKEIGVIYYVWLFIVDSTVNWNEVYPNFYKYFISRSKDLDESYCKKIISSSIPLQLLVFLNRFQKTVKPDDDKKQIVISSDLKKTHLEQYNKISPDEMNKARNYSLGKFLADNITEYVKKYISNSQIS